jgi:tRNA threonylcarbamoyl adenosine modification protein YeaZ
VLVLAFDTATAAITVALCEWVPGLADEPGSPLASVEHVPGTRIRAASLTVDHRRHAELLAPSISALLKEVDAVPADLAAIAVGVGPGPYTSLRVGLATARVMANALRIPVHGVCTLDILAWESGRTEPFVVATDARRKEVYWARYDSARVRVGGPDVAKPAEVAALGLPVVGEGAVLYPEHFVVPDAAGALRNGVVQAGAGAGAVQAGAGGAQAGAGVVGTQGVVARVDAAPLLPSAAVLAELTVARLAGGDGPPLLPPSPLYLRKPDAREPGPRKRVTQ